MLCSRSPGSDCLQGQSPVHIQKIKSVEAGVPNTPSNQRASVTNSDVFEVLFLLQLETFAWKVTISVRRNEMVHVESELIRIDSTSLCGLYLYASSFVIERTDVLVRETRQ